MTRSWGATGVNAGATEELASKAGTEVATDETRLAGVETRLSTLTWMVSFNLSLTLLLLGTGLTLWSKLGEIGAQLALLAHR